MKDVKKEGMTSMALHASIRVDGSILAEGDGVTREGWLRQGRVIWPEPRCSPIVGVDGSSKRCLHGFFR